MKVKKSLMRAFRLESQHVRYAGVGREVGPADERRARPGVGAHLVGAAHSEFHEELPPRRLADARGLGGD